MLLNEFILKHQRKIQDGTFNKIECGDEILELGYRDDIVSICFSLTMFYIDNNIPYTKKELYTGT